MKRQFIVTHRHAGSLAVREISQILNTSTFKHVTFFTKIKGQAISLDTNFDRRLVSLTNCVGFDKMLFHQRHTHTHTHSHIYIYHIYHIYIISALSPNCVCWVMNTLLLRNKLCGCKLDTGLLNYYTNYINFAVPVGYCGSMLPQYPTGTAKLMWL